MLLPGIIFLAVGLGCFLFFEPVFSVQGVIQFRFVFLFFLLFPLAFCSAGLYMIFSPYVAVWRKKRYMAMGDHIVAQISEVSQDARGNGAWYIYASAMDPLTGEMTMYKSQLYRSNPTPLLLNNQVDVYVHPSKRKRYVMDEQSAMRAH